MSQVPIKIRNFNPDKDFPTHTVLLNSAAQVDGGEQTTEDEQKQTAAMLTVDLDRDRLIIENPDDSQQLIAVCDCWQIGGNPSADLNLLVHPDWRRKGIGSVLLQRAVSHARSIQATAIDGYATPEQTIIQAFLQRHNFSAVSNFTEMHLSQTNKFHKAILPDSYTVQNYIELKGTDDDKLELIFKAGREFWGALWGHKVAPDTNAHRQELKEQIDAHFSKDLMFFLFNENDTYIGHDRVNFTEATEEPFTKTAGVGVPALHPDYHTPELAKQFALIALNKLFEKGCREFDFSSWGESDATIQAFESLGFKTTFFEIGYQLKLT